MKTIFLLRHAKSTGHNTELTDLERPLAERGEHDAAVVAARLREKDIRPSVILASPALRAIQTAKILAAGIGFRLKSIRNRKALYDDDPNKFFEVLKELNVNYGSVMLVGHNPALSEFAGMLSQGFTKSLPTSCVVAFEFECNSWKTLPPGEGKLVLFETAGKTKKSALRKEKKKSPKTLFHSYFLLSKYGRNALGKDIEPFLF